VGSEVSDLLQAIRDQYLLSWNGLHGVGHWGRVCENGMRIAGAAGADPEVLLYFALFHDSCRASERRDPGHGRRGAALAARLRGRYFDLDDERFELLARACSLHTGGRRDPSATVLACWDSDRLDLARAGIRPDPRLLCTEAARDAKLIAWASSRSMARTMPAFVCTEWGTAAPCGLKDTH
jgi:uncharacterized protein